MQWKVAKNLMSESGEGPSVSTHRALLSYSWMLNSNRVLLALRALRVGESISEKAWGKAARADRHCNAISVRTARGVWSMSLESSIDRNEGRDSSSLRLCLCCGGQVNNYENRQPYAFGILPLSRFEGEKSDLCPSTSPLGNRKHKYTTLVHQVCESAMAQSRPTGDGVARAQPAVLLGALLLKVWACDLLKAFLGNGFGFH